MTAHAISEATTSRDDESSMKNTANPGPEIAASSSSSAWTLPEWIEEKRHEWGEKVHVAEWEEEESSSSTTTEAASATTDHLNAGQENVKREKVEEESNYRSKNGWMGRDLIHDKDAPVRITEYYVHYGDGKGVDGLSTGGIGTKLTGIAQFTTRAESHRGYCHGGSMCSVMDDAVGWCGFMVTGEVKPWSGFTVQINTSLKKPIPVNSALLVTALITKIERRKVSIYVELLAPKDDDPIHATAEGLVVINRGVLPFLTKRGSLLTYPSSLELS